MDGSPEEKRAGSVVYGRRERRGGGGEEGEIVKNLATLRYISHSKRRNESVF